MGSDFLDITVNISSIASFFPFVVMLWYIKTLKKRTFGWAMFGYFTTLFLVTVLCYLFIYIYVDAIPGFHLLIVFISFFTFLLFKNEYSNNLFKKASYFFFALVLITEITEFILRGGFFTNNYVSHFVLHFTFVLQYFLYLVDTIKNRPAIIYDRKGSFLIISATFFYSLNQLFFAIIENDLRYLLAKSQYAVIIWVIFVWLYTFYLLIASYILWRNLRS
jgi:hypothetical protein